MADPVLQLRSKLGHYTRYSKNPDPAIVGLYKLQLKVALARRNAQRALQDVQAAEDELRSAEAERGRSLLAAP